MAYLLDPPDDGPEPDDYPCACGAIPTGGTASDPTYDECACTTVDRGRCLQGLLDVVATHIAGYDSDAFLEDMAQRHGAWGVDAEDWTDGQHRDVTEDLLGYLGEHEGLSPRAIQARDFQSQLRWLRSNIPTEAEHQLVPEPGPATYAPFSVDDDLPF